MAQEVQARVNAALLHLNGGEDHEGGWKAFQQTIIARMIKTLIMRLPKPERAPFVRDILQEVHGDLSWADR